MRHDSEADAPRVESAGAPEITNEMIAAGAKASMPWLYDVYTADSPTLRIIAMEVFAAMVEARNHSTRRVSR
jgi:hypothetical protein